METPEIVLEGNLYKYVLLELNGRNERFALVALPREYHSEIVDEYSRRLRNGERINRVLGGGRISRDDESRMIQTWDYSCSYGPAPLDLVEEVLRSGFQDYTLRVS